MFLIRLTLAITSLKSLAITGAVVGLVDQQPKRTTKKLQLKIVSFVNGNLSYILASVLHRHDCTEKFVIIHSQHPDLILINENTTYFYSFSIREKGFAEYLHFNFKA
jgi:hypothetical protein